MVTNPQHLSVSLLDPADKDNKPCAEASCNFGFLFESSDTSVALGLKYGVDSVPANTELEWQGCRDLEDGPTGSRCLVNLVTADKQTPLSVTVKAVGIGTLTLIQAQGVFVIDTNTPCPGSCRIPEGPHTITFRPDASVKLTSWGGECASTSPDDICNIVVKRGGTHTVSVTTSLTGLAPP